MHPVLGSPPRFSRISSLLSWAVFNGLPCNLGETKLLISHSEYFDSGQEVGHRISVHARSHHHYHYILVWLLSSLLLIVKCIYYLPRQSKKYLLLGIYYRRNGPYRTEAHSFLSLSPSHSQSGKIIHGLSLQ